VTPFDLDVRAIDPPPTLADFDGALERIAEVLRLGEQKHGGRWRFRAPAEHVVHALRHVLEWQHGRDPEDLEYAATLLLMGLQLATMDDQRTTKETHR